MSAAVSAAAAAASARKEEEEMTPYSQKDLDEGWEFKIIRSTTGRFRDPIWLRAVLQEEARAGWTLVEKFDDARVRLKRPASARAGDANSPFDPYRTWVGMKPAHLAVIIILGALAAVAVLLGIVFIFASQHGFR
jgi:hypothetical protein